MKLCFENWGPMNVLQIRWLPSGERIGKIVRRRMSDLLDDSMDDVDTFGITFPKHLDVRLKALLLGCVFLIVSILLA
jgi:hypothetical protein